MPDTLTVTELRARLYRVIDEVLATGVPQRIQRRGRAVVIGPEQDGPRLDLARLPRRTAIACTPDELVEQGFEGTWNGDL
jgi:prevent-host-death family protein